MTPSKAERLAAAFRIEMHWRWEVSNGRPELYDVIFDTYVGAVQRRRAIEAEPEEESK